MSVEKIAIIHCGFHKTASSSIQHTLAENRPFLKKHGWLYPEFNVEERSFYNKSIPLYGYYCKRPENFKHYWYHNQVTHEIANCKIHSSLSDVVWKQPKIIFSDEFISRLDVDGLTALRDDFIAGGYEIRIVCFVRDPVDLIVSVAQQQARVRSVSTTLESSRSHVEIEKIKRLKDVFGNSAEFYSFERACNHKAGPVGFFFDLIGLTLESQQAIRVNDGMSLQAVHLLSFINSKAPLFIDGNSIHKMRSRGDLDLLSKLPGDKYHLTADQALRVKPFTDFSRNEIGALLGSVFFLKERDFSVSLFVWGDLQFDFLEEIFDKVDIYILFRICDFLIELKEKEPINECRVDRYLSMVRGRIDKESNVTNQRTSPFMKSILLKIKKILSWSDDV